MQRDNVFEEFLTDLHLAGRAARTIHQHRYELERYGRWLDEQQLDWQAIQRRQIKHYLRLRAHLGVSSRTSVISSLRVFYGWCVDEGYMDSSPAQFRTPTRPEPVPRALTTEQIRQLVAHLRACEGRTAQRDAALLLTALYAGLRACELAALRWPTVDLQAQTITIRLSKMNHGRAVSIHPELQAILTNWKKCQALDDNAPVFSLDGKAFVANRCGKIARKYAKLLNLPLTAHVLRHTFATHAYLHSRDIYAVSKALGHKQLKQTEIYTVAAATASAPARFMVLAKPTRSSPCSKSNGSP